MMDFKAKTSLYEGLERYKVRCTIRGDRMRKMYDSDENRTAAHMPSQAGRRVLMVNAVARRPCIESWNVPCLFIRSPGDQRFRIVMQ